MLSGKTLHGLRSLAGKEFMHMHWKITGKEFIRMNLEITSPNSGSTKLSLQGEEKDRSLSASPTPTFLPPLPSALNASIPFSSSALNHKLSVSKPQAPNFKPNPRPQTLDPKPQTLKPKPVEQTR